MQTVHNFITNIRFPFLNEISVINNSPELKINIEERELPDIHFSNITMPLLSNNYDINRSVNDAIIQERNEELVKLTDDLSCLHDMMLELDNILGIQGSQLDKVESNVETTFVNVEDGVVHLDSAVEEKVSADGLITKIIAGSLATVGVVGTIALVIVFI